MTSPSIEVESTGFQRNDGVFWHLGLELATEHRVPLGGWGLEVGLGASSSLMVLSAPGGYEGDLVATRLGPFFSTRTTLPDRRRIRGFSPAPHGTLHGIEMRVSRHTALDRGPVESGWAVSLGWTFQVSM